MGEMMKRIKYIAYFVVIVLSLIALMPMMTNKPAVNGVPQDKFCEEDSDCACGINLDTGDCFYGNREYVDVNQQCPDFCTGIGGNLEIRCVNNSCERVEGNRKP